MDGARNLLKCRGRPVVLLRHERLDESPRRARDAAAWRRCRPLGAREGVPCRYAHRATRRTAPLSHANRSGAPETTTPDPRTIAGSAIAATHLPGSHMRRMKPADVEPSRALGHRPRSTLAEHVRGARRASAHTRPHDCVELDGRRVREHRELRSARASRARSRTQSECVSAAYGRSARAEEEWNRRCRSRRGRARSRRSPRHPSHPLAAPNQPMPAKSSWPCSTRSAASFDDSRCRIEKRIALRDRWAVGTVKPSHGSVGQSPRTHRCSRAPVRVCSPAGRRAPRRRSRARSAGSSLPAGRG